jgi:bisphosphoglycerate-dependent phosphoglycerate mutase
MQRQPGQFLATAQATLDSFIDNAQNCDLHQIAKTIFNSWGSLDKQSKQYKVAKADVQKNAWPKWIVEKRNLGGINNLPIAQQINLRAAVEAIIRLGYWFFTNRRLDDRGSMEEVTARLSFEHFLKNWQRTVTERQLQPIVGVVDAGDQYLIKSTTARIVLGDATEVEMLRKANQIVDPQQVAAHAQIYKLINVNNRRVWVEMGQGYCRAANGGHYISGASQQTCQGGLNQWIVPDQAHPSEDIVRKIVTGLKSEAAFHITNGEEDEDKLKRWNEMLDLSKEQSQVWAFAQESFDMTDKLVQIEFKLNDTYGPQRKTVVRGVASNSSRKWIQSLERYLQSDAFEKMPEAFHNIFFGTGNGALSTPDAVQNNIGVVHKLYTRHAFSCANAAKTLGVVFKPNPQTVADIFVVPAVVKKLGTAYLKGSDFLDSKLTDLGVHNSIRGGYRLAETCHAAGIPAPSNVFTSTMQRTLETARYMQEGMTAYAATTNNNWQFQTLPMTIMPGIKEQGSGAENQPRNTIAELYNEINAANNNGFNGQFAWQANGVSINDDWITGHNSNWATHNNYDNFAYFQQKMGEKLRLDMGALQANGQNNIPRQTNMITTHSRQMKSWFGAFVGENKPDNNDTWKFDYVRMPGANGDKFILVEPVPQLHQADPKNVRVSVRNEQFIPGQHEDLEFANYYRGFKQRKAQSMEVANPNLNNAAIAKQKFETDFCRRCGSKFLNFYAATGL